MFTLFLNSYHRIIVTLIRELRLDHAVDSLQDAVVDMGLEPIQDPVPVTFDGVGSFFDGFNSAMGRPVIPFFQIWFCQLWRLIPEILEIQSNLVCADSFQILIFQFDFFEKPALAMGQVVRVL